MTPAPPRDRGSASLSIVLLTPVFVVVAFMAFQAAMWTHARTEARAAARDAAVQIARFGASPTDVERSTFDSLGSKSALVVESVEIAELAEIESSGVVAVTIRAIANGIIVGTSTDVVVTEILPYEEFRE